MVAVILQLARGPDARRHRRRPRHRDLHRQRGAARRPASTPAATAKSRPVMDRSADRPDRAGRDALRAVRARGARRERGRRQGSRRATASPLARPRDRLGRGRGRRDRRRTRSSSRSAGSATGCSRRPSVHRDRDPGRPAQAPHATTSSARTSRRCSASAPPRSSGSSTCCSRSPASARRSRWRSSAPAPPPTSSSRSSSRTRPCSSSIPGIGKKLAERIIFELKEKVSAAGVAAGYRRRRRRQRAEGEVVAALQALGYSLAEAREASRLALQDPAVGAGLEERVKAALRTLLRD